MTIKLWLHPAIVDKHVVSNTRDTIDGHVCNVATCQCGWSVNTRLDDRFGYVMRENAIDVHWADEIAKLQLAVEGKVQ